MPQAVPLHTVALASALLGMLFGAAFGCGASHASEPVPGFDGGAVVAGGGSGTGAPQGDTAAVDASFPARDAAREAGVMSPDGGTVRSHDAAPAPADAELADAAVADAAAVRVPDAGSVPRRPSPPTVPVIATPCPVLETGTVSVLGVDVRLWVGEPRDDVEGMVYLYWHATGSDADEAMSGLGDNLQRILDTGGLVAAFTVTQGTGETTANSVWYTGDFAVADVIVACAVEQLGADPRRVYTGGCAVGGIQAGSMAYHRSSYLAAALPMSGGVAFLAELEEPAHVPALMTVFGSGEPISVIDFRQFSEQLSRDLADRGGMVVSCDHGNTRCGALREELAGLRDAQWRFMQDHPYGLDADPYVAGLPNVYPGYCHVGPH